MSYALEDCGGRMGQRGVFYTGAENMDYYKIAYDETIGAGVAKNNGDALHYTFMRIARKYGWKVYEEAFRLLYALEEDETAMLKTDYDKFCFSCPMSQRPPARMCARPATPRRNLS